MFRPVTPLLFLSFFLSGCAHFQQQEQRQQEQLAQTAQLLERTIKLQSSLDEQAQGIKLLEAELLKSNKSVASLTQQLTTFVKESEEEKTQPEVKVKTCKQGNTYIVGEEEWVYLPIVKEYYKARIDSGATTSSISASNIERFERDGKKWVRFDLEHINNGSKITLERPLVRRVAIKQSSSDKKESRLVISLMIKMGNLSENTQFTLADRSQMDFPVLLGRSFLRDIALIDVSQQYTQSKFVEAAIIHDNNNKINEQE